MNEPDPEQDIPSGRHIDVADGHRSPANKRIK